MVASGDSQSPRARPTSGAEFSVLAPEDHVEAHSRGPGLNPRIYGDDYVEMVIPDVDPKPGP